MEFAGYLDRLSPEERAVLDPLLHRRTCGRGSVLFREGEIPTSLFLLRRGTVKMVASEAGRDVLVEILFPGEICGALGALDAEPYKRTAVCLEEVELSAIPRQEFVDRVAEFPGLLVCAMDVCRLKVREQREMMADMALEPAERRVAHALLLLASRLGRRTERGLALPMVMDRSELSSMIGATVDGIARILSRLERDGILEEGERQVLVLDEGALRKLAGTA